LHGPAAKHFLTFKIPVCEEGSDRKKQPVLSHWLRVLKDDGPRAGTIHNITIGRTEKGREHEVYEIRRDRVVSQDELESRR
jgi:hypothetical protein